MTKETSALKRGRNSSLPSEREQEVRVRIFLSLVDLGVPQKKAWARAKGIASVEPQLVEFQVAGRGRKRRVITIARGCPNPD